MDGVANHVSRDGGRALRVLIGLGLVELIACGSVTPALEADGGAGAAGSGGTHDAGADVSPADVPSSGGVAGQRADGAADARDTSSADVADAGDARGALEGKSCFVYEPSSYKVADGATGGLFTRACPQVAGCYVCRWGDENGPAFDGSGCSGGAGVRCFASCDACL
jgi:hypothetical protein